MHGIVFLVSLSGSSLLTYKNAIRFWLLILYPATLVNSFISSSIFLAESLGFSLYSIMSSTNNEFYFSLSNLYAFYSSSYLIARTSSTMLSKGGESGHPCLVPDLNGNTCSFSELLMPPKDSPYFCVLP